MTIKPNCVNILFIASEADPFVKIGGLGDVAGSLPLAIRNIQDENSCYDIRLAIPLYGSIRQKYPDLEKVADFKVNTGSLSVNASVYTLVHQGMVVYFISGAPVHEDDPVYGVNFLADAEKFIFFSLACLELPRVLKWKIDILHANDWHTALAIHQLEKMRLSRPGYAKIKSVLTVHNLPFMGSGSEIALARFGIEPAQDSELPVWARTIPLPMGLASTSRIVAVSPSYAEEVLTPEFGCGLENYLQKHYSRITGILNGIDQSLWNPVTDPLIPTNFSSGNASKKVTNKKALQKEMGLPVNPDTPLVVIISRMDHQKGIDLALSALRETIDPPCQSIILGSGNPRLEDTARTLEQDYPHRIRVKITFDTSLSHRMYAGADMLLMPSRYEPCGLSQMIAMRYGTVPVARATGGLKDSIRDARSKDTGNGFLFEKADVGETALALSTAIKEYRNKKRWHEIMTNAMECDFSWQGSAGKYTALYHELISL